MTALDVESAIMTYGPTWREDAIDTMQLVLDLADAAHQPPSSNAESLRP
jgi:hypothetical protein